MTSSWGWLALTAGIAWTGVGAAQAPPSFDVAPAYAAGNNCRSVTVGEFNQDGIPDLAVGCNQSAASGQPFGAYLLPGTGAGAFGAPLGFAVSEGPHALASGRFNADGLLDLATADYQAQTVSVLLATGPGTFAPAASYVVGTSPKAVAVADFDADGVADLAVAAGGTSDGRVVVLLGTGSGTFGAATSYTAGGSPTAIAVADFNGDGIADVATANNAARTASVLLGTGTGTFAAAVAYPMGGSDGGPTGIAAADFNADGVIDLAVSNEQTAYPKRSYVALLLGSGTGTFGAAVKFDVGDNARPRGLVAADFNADGVPDVAVANQDKNNVSILLATGSGAFLPPYSYGARAMVGNSGTAIGANFLATGDLNADGRPDLAVASPKEGNVAILLATSAGTFAGASSYDAGISPSSVAVRDFNGDGVQDMAVSNLVTNDVSVFLGAGGGRFGVPVDYTAGSMPTSVAAADFNGDAVPDLAVANLASDSVALLLGTGSGAFGAAVHFPTGTSPASLALADFNGDGFRDLAVAYYGGGTVGILLGTGAGSFQPIASHSSGGTSTAAVVAGDLNADGFQDLAVANSGSGSVSVLLGAGNGSFAPAVTYAAGVSPVALAVGEFNADGVPDLAVTGGILVPSTHVSVLLGSGGGAFAAPVTYAAGSRPAAVSVGDFNGDGASDLVVAHNLDSGCCYPLTDTIWIYPGIGNGTFGAPLDWTVGRRPRALAVADFNADALADVVVAGGNELSSSPGYYWGYDVRVLLNTTAVATQLSVADTTVVEGDAGTTGAVFTVSLSVPSAQPVTVAYATVSGTASAGSDYDAAAGTLTFAPGTTSQSVTVTVLSDVLDEPDETFFVDLSGAVNATVADGQGRATILDDDAPPALAIADARVTEGDVGTVDVAFVVTLSAPSGQTVSVDFATADGAATSPGDYLAASGTLTFTPGDTLRTVTVTVNGDLDVEPDEDFAVSLANASAATVADGLGVGLIVNDDTPPFAKGDFDGDGLADLLFRNVTDGALNRVWFMDGPTRAGEAAITPDAASGDWLIRGADDFDSAANPGSGRDLENDLVFWNRSTGEVEFWLMDGTHRPGAPVPLSGGAVLPVNWDLSATADFDHDDRPDIVWRNVDSQKIVIWTMNGTAKTGNIIPTPSQAVDANWTIVAGADYNNDGDTDFLWYNVTSGRIVTWYMDAAVVRLSGQFTTPNAAGDANWKVVASADYSRAYVPATPPVGSPDIVWRNDTSGNQVVWHLDFASTRVHGEFTNPTANSAALDWVIVGPR